MEAISTAAIREKRGNGGQQGTREGKRRQLMDSLTDAAWETHLSNSLKVRLQISSTAFWSTSTSCDACWNILLRVQVTSCRFCLAFSFRLALPTEQNAAQICCRDTTFTERQGNQMLRQKLLQPEVKVVVRELTMETLLKTQQLDGDPVEGTTDLIQSF